MPTEEFIVLANSDKPGGRCVAGISTISGEWVRPVSARSSSSALTWSDCRAGGRLVEVLDIVRFGHRGRAEDPAQPENVLIDETDWTLAGRVSDAEAYERLRPNVVSGPELLGGIEKGMPDEVARAGVDSSLALIEPDSIRFSSEDPFHPWQRRKARALFELSRQPYNLGITDLVVAPRIREADNGTYSAEELGLPGLPHTLLTVSLAEPLNGKRYKLAAAVQFLA